MEDTELGSLHGTEVTGPPRREVRMLRQGDVAGRYVIIDTLGRGGMGVVYSAFDPELDRRVALKLLLSREDSPRRARGRTRLVREAQALAKLKHPNVVTVYDVGQHDDRVFVAMEYIDGITLKRWIQRGPHPWKQVIDVLSSAGLGLAAAHAKRLTHRDFKPDNVMLEHETSRVVVMDFGLATAPMFDATELAIDIDPSLSSLQSGETAEPLTHTGSVMGTPAYMAPEQHAGEPGPYSDQFSFCVTLYEALYGHRPFAGATAPELLAAAMQGNVEPPPPGDRVPCWLRDVVVRGLSPDPRERWPSMEALLRALHDNPSRKRWVASVGVGIAVSVGAVYASGLVQDRQHESGCEERARGISEVWNDDARLAAAGAFGASALPYAESAWVRAEKRLDDAAARWSEIQREACRAERSTDPRLRDARDACLDAQLHKVGHLVRMFSNANGSTIQRAPDLADLDIEACSDDDWLRSTPALPADPEARDAHNRMRTNLQYSAVLRSADHLEEAARLQQSIITEARQWGDEQILAAARFQLGGTRSQQTRFREAAELLEDAYFGAMATSNRDLATRATRALVIVHGNDLANADIARRWARHNQLLIGDQPTSTDQADLELALARVELTTGDHAQALERAQRALSIFVARAGDQSARAHDARLVIMLAHDRLGRADEAIAIGRTLLRARAEADGETHPATLKARSNLGAILINNGQYDEAEQHLHIAIEGLQPPDLETASALDDLALVMVARLQLREAKVLNERALTLRRALLPDDHLSIGHSLLNLASIQFSVGEYEQALASVQEARSILLDMGRADEALDAIERGIAKARTSPERTEGSDLSQVPNRQ